MSSRYPHSIVPPIILIIGKNGQVGWELHRSLSCIGQVIALGRDDLDLSSSDKIRETIDLIMPNIIVNAAAYTAVDKAEEESDEAFFINASVPGVIANAASRIGALFVHYSTDYVFDGTKNAPYLETDDTSPINVYGQSKLKGEQEIQSHQGDFLILRTSWVYASRGMNFMLSMLRLAKEREELRIVSDQTGSPTPARLISDVTSHVLKKAICERVEGVFESGIYNLTTSGQTTWYDFARNIIKQGKESLDFNDYRIQNVTAIDTADYPTPAKRPLYSCLSCEKLTKHYDIHLPDWNEQLVLCLSELE